MREYTLKQVIDKLERNSNLKFQFVRNEDYRVEDGTIIHVDEEYRVVDISGKPSLSNFTLKDRFILLNQPVDKSTAFLAFWKGKTIYCEYQNCKFRYKPKNNGKYNILENENAEPVSIEEILYGRWFIEEE